jgi:hypothetical protein
MATYTASKAVHIATVIDQVDTITLTGTGKTIRVHARTGTNHVFFTAESLNGPTPATPTVGGNNCYLIDPDFPLDYPWTGAGAVVKIITGAAQNISIMLV